jgi:hypothetical protein
MSPDEPRQFLETGRQRRCWLHQSDAPTRWSWRLPVTCNLTLPVACAARLPRPALAPGAALRSLQQKLQRLARDQESP